MTPEGERNVHSFITYNYSQSIYEYHHNTDKGVLRGLRYSFTDIDVSEEEETTFLMCKVG